MHEGTWHYMKVGSELHVTAKLSPREIATTIIEQEVWRVPDPVCTENYLLSCRESKHSSQVVQPVVQSLNNLRYPGSCKQL